MASGDIHTVPTQGKSVNEMEGASRAISRHDTMVEAPARGRKEADGRAPHPRLGAIDGVR